MKRLKFRNKRIEEILDIGDGYIVLEDQYEYPVDKSNLYKVGYDFQPTWDAEVHVYPGGHAAHYTYVWLDGNMLMAATGDCTVTLDRDTGKILKEVFTK